MNKPLSETHPTLVREWKKKYGTFLSHDELVQSCTVDQEEHEAVLKRELYYKEHMEAEQRARIDEVERLNKQYGDCYYALAEANVEISRLKKEHAEQLMYAIHQTEKRCLVEGERRAKSHVQRVLEERFELWKPSGASENRLECIRMQRELTYIMEKLGLGEEENK